MSAYIEDSQNVTAVIKIFDMKLSSPSFQSQQITEKKEGPIPRTVNMKPNLSDGDFSTL